MNRVLDRVYQPDDRNFPVRPLLMAIDATKPRSYTWGLVPRLDQGEEGACVGFGFAHELAARPVVVQNVTNDVAFRIYGDAKKIDEWPGENYSGTSVLAGAKVLTARGNYVEYRWATDVRDLALAIGYHGPAVLGINWRDGMWDPDADGTLHVTGSVAGGHCIICRGYSVRTRRFLLTNSWGPSWGLIGSCYVSEDDMAKLLADQGEACIPVRHKIV